MTRQNDSRENHFVWFLHYAKKNTLKETKPNQTKSNQPKQNTSFTQKALPPSSCQSMFYANTTSECFRHESLHNTESRFRILRKPLDRWPFLHRVRVRIALCRQHSAFGYPSCWYTPNIIILCQTKNKYLDDHKSICLQQHSFFPVDSSVGLSGGRLVQSVIIRNRLIRR